MQKVKKEFDSISKIENEGYLKSNIKIEKSKISALDDEIRNVEKILRSPDFWKIENENLKLDELDWYLRFSSTCSNEEFFDLGLRSISAPQVLKSLVEPRFQADLEEFLEYVNDEREVKVRQIQELEALRCRNGFLQDAMDTLEPCKKNKIFDRNEFDAILTQLENKVFDFRRKYPVNEFRLKTVEIVPENKDECIGICTEIEKDIKRLNETKSEIAKSMKQMTNDIIVLKIKQETYFFLYNRSGKVLKLL